MVAGELCTVNQSVVEIPRWVRFLTDRLRFGGPQLTRRDVLLVEAFCIAIAVVTFTASFLVSDEVRASVVRMTASIPLIGGYLTAMCVRVLDQYRLWPGSENAPPETPRTWRSLAAECAFFATVGILGIVTAAWLILS
jgi:hypothetical protein